MTAWSKDNKLVRLIEVKIRDKEKDLFCTYDRRNNCVHSGFASAIPQVYVVMKKLRSG